MSENVRQFPAEPMRVESGPIQFGDDWPGVFLRGDNAMYYAMILDHTLESLTDEKGMLNKAILKGLVGDLKSCQVK